MFNAIFDPKIWAAVPFQFWSLVFFVFGAIVGSFLNVCIHRLPLDLSIVSPPSHCPSCKYSIPWFLNIPLFTWLSLRGKCRNCGAPISPRYFIVELLTASTFLGCWAAFGRASAPLALAYAVFLSGLIVATFVDFEHFIIPDQITLGGIVVGLLASFFIPALHGARNPGGSMPDAFIGAIVGGGLLYAILRFGKLLFGRQKLAFPAGARIVFSETALHLPDKDIPFEDLFYRPSDVILMRARTVELIHCCYKDVTVRLTPTNLSIGDEEFDPEQVPCLEVVTDEIVLPREAMGLGDVKFMAAIGAFLGWRAVLFSLMISSVIGSIVGLMLIVTRKREWSSRLPYGPYIAVAATIWVFWGERLLRFFFP